MKLLIASEGLTQKKFAEEINMHYPHANKFFTGRTPNMEFIKKVIARFPEVDLNWLLLTDNSEPEVVLVKEPTPGYTSKITEYLDTIEENVKKLRDALTQ